MKTSELFKGGIRVLVNADSEQEAVLLSEGWKAACAAGGVPGATLENKADKPDKGDKSKGKTKAADAADGDTSTP